MQLYSEAECLSLENHLKRMRDGDYSVRIYQLMDWWGHSEDDIDFIVVMTPGDQWDTPDPEREYLIDPNEFFSAIENAIDDPYYIIHFSIVFKDGSRIVSVPGFDEDFVQFEYIPPIRKPSKQAHLRTMISWKGKEAIQEALDAIVAFRLDSLDIHTDDDRFEETKAQIMSKLMEECDLKDEDLYFEGGGF